MHRPDAYLGLYVIDGVLAVAMATPENTKLVRRLAQISAIPLGPVFGLPGEIDDAMSVICANERSLADSIAALERNALCVEPDLAVARNSKLAKTEPLVHVLNEIIHFGLRDRATAIPLEPREVFSRIRSRIDGPPATSCPFRPPCIARSFPGSRLSAT